jgi:hypothetical protein
MHTSGIPTNDLLLGTARNYGGFGATAITNTGSTVINGSIGEYPGSTVTGFPPGTFTGTEDLANTAAMQAKAYAQAAFITGNAMTATAISATLDGQTLTPGVYKESSGSFNLAASGNGTLTFNGAGVYIFQCSSTLVTGAGGIPTMTLENGALASQIYFLVGSSATINSGSAGTFNGNIIAETSITDTLLGSSYSEYADSGCTTRQCPWIQQRLHEPKSIAWLRSCSVGCQLPSV